MFCLSFFVFIIPFQIDASEIIAEQALGIELFLVEDRITPEALEIRMSAFNKVKEDAYGEALEILMVGLEKFPANFPLQVLFAAVLGDYGCSVSDALGEKMIQRSKEIFDVLMLSVEHQPASVMYKFKNEYYYRFEMFKQQYENGRDGVSAFWNSEAWISEEGFFGYYNQGVGAANFAKQLLIEGRKKEAIHYAKKALVAWAQFFSYENTYYNSYVHYGMALGILGQKDEMIKAMKRGVILINADLTHPEFKRVIEFIDEYVCMDL